MEKHIDLSREGMTHCPQGMEEALNYYIDGDLPFPAQPQLFAHLATCDSCRQVLDAVMKFRRMSRQEYLALPPSADDIFFEKLAHQKAMNNLVDRAADRQSLWNARAAISLRSAVVMGVFVFLIGIFIPVYTPEAHPQQTIIGEEDLVEFPHIFPSYSESAIYVFYPGLTIEASKGDELKALESL